MKRWRHAVVLVGLAAMLMGPTPGHVGGCGSSADIADAEFYCFEREIAVASRSGRVPDGTAIRDRCTGTNWPPDCAPTQTEVNTCLAALEDRARRDTPFEGIEECTAICGAARSTLSSVPARAEVLPGDAGLTAEPEFR